MPDRSGRPSAGEARGAGTVGKALAVLDQVAGYGRPVRFAEVQRDSPFPKATLYRLIQTLTSQGMLRLDPESGTYALGVRLVRLAHAAWHTTSLAPIARPHIDALSAELGETVHLAQLDHGQVLYVDKRNATVPVRMYSQAGKVGPAYCTGVGKAMMAFLPAPDLEDTIAQQSFHRFTPNTLTDRASLLRDLAAIRDRGHAFDDEEHEAGIICLAVPILTDGRQVLGAISVTATSARRSLDELGELAPALRAAARKIATEASAWRFPDRAAEPLATTG
ncbi:IclR family transcriptional regulator [Oceaniglobus trochenteri]|uniref:IclR family transcriptional regulator n=1 Tax=Oceaniglobus trochenteri TaxID=2763260 RepID=UPI001CFF9045|nr:IclR family transcriptional regulator [Oceaniglobus trochenteri]